MGGARTQEQEKKSKDKHSFHSSHPPICSELRRRIIPRARKNRATSRDFNSVLVRNSRLGPLARAILLLHSTEGDCDQDSRRHFCAVHRAPLVVAHRGWMVGAVSKKIDCCVVPKHLTANPDRNGGIQLSPMRFPGASMPRDPKLGPLNQRLLEQDSTSCQMSGDSLRRERATSGPSPRAISSSSSIEPPLTLPV